MSKFVRDLTASDKTIKETRAKALAEDTLLEVDAFISNLRRQKSKLNSKLNDLTDLAPDNTYSLRPGAKGFDAAKWVAELHQVRMELAVKVVELEEAQFIYDTYFGDDEDEVTTSKGKK